MIGDMRFEQFKPLEARDRDRAAQLRMHPRDFVTWRHALREDYKERMRVRRYRPIRVLRPWMVLPWVVRDDG